MRNLPSHEHGYAVFVTTLEHPGAGGVIDQLNREWTHMHPRVAPALGRWFADRPELAACSLAPGTRVQMAYEQADAYLLTLLDHAHDARPDATTTADNPVRLDAAGDRGEPALAARVVLQLMLQAVVRLAHALRSDQVDEADAEAQAVAAMYEAIVAYPLGRRQRCAANLRFDAQRLARRRLAEGELVRGAEVQLSPVPKQTAHTEAEPVSPWPSSASEQLLGLLTRAVERGDLSREQATLLVEGTAYGWSRGLARRLGISMAAVRQRRRYAVAKLRASVADLDPDADWVTHQPGHRRRPDRSAQRDAAGSTERPGPPTGDSANVRTSGAVTRPVAGRGRTFVDTNQSDTPPDPWLDGSTSPRLGAWREAG